MNCERFQNWLLARSDEPESRIEESEMQEHLVECAACRDAYESFRFVLSVSRMSAHLDTPPNSIDHLILDMARKRQSQRSWIERLQTFFLLPVPATVIALVFVASFTLLFYTKHGELRSTKSETALIQGVDQPSEHPNAVPAVETSSVSAQPATRSDDDRLVKSDEIPVPGKATGEMKKKGRAVLKKELADHPHEAASEKTNEKMDRVPIAPMPVGDELEEGSKALSSEIAISRDIDEFSDRLTPTPTPTPSSTPTATPSPISTYASP